MAANKSPAKKRWIAISFFSILALLLVFLASFPTIVSTETGKNWTLDLINRQIYGKISIEKLSLNWFGSQNIEGFVLSDQNQEPIASFTQFYTKNSLFSLFSSQLRQKFVFKDTKLTSPFLIYSRDPDGKTNFAKVFRPAKKATEEKERKPQFPSIKGNLAVIEGQIKIISPRIEPVEISGIKLNLFDSPSRFNLQAATKQGAIQGNIDAEGTFENGSHIFFNINEFPLTSFDQLWGTKLFTEAFGKTLTLKGELKKNKAEILFSLNATSTNFSCFFDGASSNGIFHLNPSSSASFVVTPPFFKALFSQSTGQAWSLAKKTDVILTIKQLEFPLRLKKLKWQDITFSGDVSVERAEISHPSFGPISFNFLSAELKTSQTLQMNYSGQMQSKVGLTQIEGECTLDSSKQLFFNTTSKGLPVDLLQLFFEEAPSLTTFLGQTIDITNQGYYFYENGGFNVNFDINSSRALLQGTIRGDSFKDLALDVYGDLFYSSKYAAYLGPAPQVKVTANGSFYHHSFSLPLVNATLSNPFWTLNVRGHVGEKGQPFSFEKMQLVAVGTLRKLPLQGGEILIDDGSFSAKIEGEKNTIQWQTYFSTMFQGHEESKALQMSGDIQNFIHEGNLDFKGMEATVNGSLIRFPVGILDSIFAPPTSFVTLFGSQIDLTVKGHYSPSAEHRLMIDLVLNGQDFRGDIGVSINDTLTIAQDRPAYLHWEMTPVRYQALMKLLRPQEEPSFVLTRGSGIDLTISQFICPPTTPETAKAFLCQSGFYGDLKVGPLHFRSRKTREEMALLDLNASIRGENFSEAIQVEGNGKIVSTTIPKPEEGSLAFKWLLIGFFTPEGNFRPEGTVKGELNLNLIPVKEMTGVLPMKESSRGQIQALLGPLVNARLHGEVSRLTGEITADVSSSNLKASLPVRLQNGVLTLRQSVTAEITLTEQINEIYLKDVAPVLIKGAWSANPVRVYIEANGFSIPFRPFNLRGVNVERAVIDLGKITVRNGGPIQALMNFLDAKEITDEGIMEAWFTPIYMSLKDGVAVYQRFDALLAGNVQIALWGRIDLNKDKVRMTLGISPTTLQQRFNVRGLANKDMFQVKMRGSTSQVELDWSSARTRIGILMARSAGGQLGNIVGGIIEQILGTLGDEETPPPTTYPFPWDTSGRRGN